MKISERINMFITNLISPTNKNEESQLPSLDIRDMPIQQESFSNIVDEDRLDLNSMEAESEGEFHKDNNAVEELSASDESQSQLDNTAYMSLAQQCCDMIKELDRMQHQVSDEQIKDFIIQQKSRIREALMLSGAILIDEETEFNLLRHQNVNGGVVKNGTPITETVEAGVEIEGRVMVKAKVDIEKNEQNCFPLYKNTEYQEYFS